MFELLIEFTLLVGAIGGIFLLGYALGLSGAAK